MKKTLLVALLALLVSAPKFAHAAYDGSPSTGSFTVVYSTNLAQASATGSMTILDVSSAVTGTYVGVGPYTFLCGRDFLGGVSTNATAANLAAAINASNAPFTAAAVNTNVVSLTAVAPGAAYNYNSGTPTAGTLRTSNSATISVTGAGSTGATGGLNNASACVNGACVVQGRDWFVQDTSSNTAISLAIAFRHNPALRNLVSAYWTGTSAGIVYLRSTLTPTAYALSAADNSASNANLTPSAATMAGNSSVGNLALNECNLGVLNAIPTSNYPPGCTFILSSAPWDTYQSTQAVVGTQSWAIIISSGSSR